MYYYSRTVRVYYINIIESVPSEFAKDSHEVFRKRNFFLRSRARYRNVIFSSDFFLSFISFTTTSHPRVMLRSTIMPVRCFEIRRIFLVISIFFFLRTTFSGFFLLDPVDPHRTLYSSPSSHGRAAAAHVG